MIQRLYPLLLTVLFMQGCAQFPIFNKPDPDFSLSPQQTIESADQLANQGQWQDAIALLRRAQKMYVDSPLLQRKEWELSNQWQEIKLTIDHKILIIETNALRQRLSLMEVVTTGEPDSYSTKTRVLFWEQLLKQKFQDLIACSDYQLDKQPDLAELCLTLAAEIELTPEVDERLAELDRRKPAVQESERLQGSTLAIDNPVKPPAKKQPQKKVAKQNNNDEQVQTLLASAQIAMEQGDFPSAVSDLKQAVSIQPESSDFWFEIENLQWQIENQIDALIRQGEVYYGYDQLEAAVTTWEKVLVLDPERRDIADRINRARKVLVKLESIKKQTENKE
ncbi:MAG: hypothetical protein C0631_05160 [Sedimenticola sp.]|nr:MAG: hypothetical protein C0631_05160 [Sedimenticola sp.]